MPNLTAVCYLFSLLFYGIGYSKTLVFKNAVEVNAYGYVSQATVYFVLAIFLAVIGSLFFYIKHNRIIEMKDIEFREATGSKLDDKCITEGWAKCG